jgi:transposase-like protein
MIGSVKWRLVGINGVDSMSPRKLSDSDREKILDLYRNSEETTSTLATRYGVSSSTISRFLKNNLSESEYEDLIQAKRLARTSNLTSGATTESQSEKKSKSAQKELEEETKLDEKDQAVAETSSSEEATIPPIVKLKANQEEDDQKQDTDELDTSDLEIDKNIPESESPIMPITSQKDDDELVQNNSSITYLDEESDLESINLIQAMFGEDIDDEDDFDDEDDEDDDWDEEEEVSPQEITHTNQIRVLPLSQASFPHTCYLVIDRSAELITRPLKEFADLGKIPSEEVSQPTLPIFDNHRVAKRFSHRRGKVIKVPDGRILQKTSEHLSAKGITRLLMDGKIYAL